ncbi:MAG: hypothetical protein WKG00_02475 [Polyangiaceae bacterium]
MADEKRSTPKDLGRVLGRATTSVVNLGVAGAAAVGAAALHSWPVLALGGAAYAALVAWDMVTPEFWRKSRRGGTASPLPDPEKLGDPATREAVRAIRAAEAALEQVLAETPPEILKHLTVVLSTLRELEERAARLVHRAEAMAGYLRTADAGPVRADVERLADKARRARDEEARSQYESARAAREGQLLAISDIEDAQERIVANLSRIVATMESLPAQVVRMRVLDDQAMDALLGDMNHKLERVNGEIQSFEDALKNLVENTKS